MEAAMEFLPINNIKQEKEAEAPTSACGDENNTNNSNSATADQPDSVENKVSFYLALKKIWKPHMNFLPVLMLNVHIGRGRVRIHNFRCIRDKTETRANWKEKRKKSFPKIPNAKL